MKPEIHGGNIYKYDHKVYDFSANLNPQGMPTAAKKALIESIDQYESYPDPDCRELKSIISRFHGVSEDRICCGNGAADIIFRIAMAFRPGSALIVAPAFSEYAEALELAGCLVEYLEMKEEDGFHVPQDISDRVAGYDMVFICNPSNPTGIVVDRNVILSMASACSRGGGRLIVDECFAEFLENEGACSILDCIENLSGIIVLKSFTKLFSMAGLRLGYCICSDTEDCDAIDDTMQTWPVSTASAKAGAAAMSAYKGDAPAVVAPERNRLKSGLKELGFKLYDSEANYVFFKSGFPLDEPLQTRGILIRNCANYHGLCQGYYRIAVRTYEENSFLLEALRNICYNNTVTRL